MKTTFDSKKFKQLPKGIRELAGLFSFYEKYIHYETTKNVNIDIHGNAVLSVGGLKIKLFYRLKKDEIAIMKQDALEKYKRQITYLKTPIWMQEFR